jgi:hypothetical protein
VADGVDTSVDEVQAAVLDAPVDRARAQAQRPQLRVRDQAVLRRGELGEHTVGVLGAIVGGLAPHTGTKASTTVTLPRPPRGLADRARIEGRIRQARPATPKYYTF